MSKEEIEENLKSMSLGDHLEELRIRMILILAGLLIGMLVCLFFGRYLIAFLERPYHQASSVFAQITLFSNKSILITIEISRFYAAMSLHDHKLRIYSREFITRKGIIADNLRT